MSSDHPLLPLLPLRDIVVFPFMVLPLFVAGFVATFVATLQDRVPHRSIRTVSLFSLGVVYVGLLLPFLVLIRLDEDGSNWVLFVLLIAMLGDTGGYVVGRTLGRRKLLPSISPGKTVEGLLGGIATATLVGAGLPFLFPELVPSDIAFGPQKACLLSIPIAIVAVIGDLIASVLKRLAGVKDSGGVVPGIGGMLDLFDSLILSAPVGYLLLRCFLL